MASHRTVFNSVVLGVCLGHATVTTTLAIYTHLFDDDHAETMCRSGSDEWTGQRVECRPNAVSTIT